MGDYVLVCIVLFSTILVCKSWPYEAREYNHYHQTYGPRTSDAFPNQTNIQRRTFETVLRGDPPDAAVIHYPDEITFEAKGKGVNCTDNICDDAKGYPYDHIRRIIAQRRAHYRNLFGGVDGSIVDLGNRLHPDDPEAIPLCSIVKMTKYPKTMTNDKKVEKFIVNDGEFTQGLVIEKCNPDAVCGDATFPTGYEPKCIQKYASKRLLAIDADMKGEPAFDSFIVPSCCVCVVKKLKN